MRRDRYDVGIDLRRAVIGEATRIFRTGQFELANTLGKFWRSASQEDLEKLRAAFDAVAPEDPE